MNMLCQVICEGVTITATEDHHFSVKFTDLDGEVQLLKPIPFCYLEQFKYAFHFLYEGLKNAGFRDVRDKDVPLPEVDFIWKKGAL